MTDRRTAGGRGPERALEPFYEAGKEFASKAIASSPDAQKVRTAEALCGAAQQSPSVFDKGTYDASRRYVFAALDAEVRADYAEIHAEEWARERGEYYDDDDLDVDEEEHTSVRPAGLVLRVPFSASDRAGEMDLHAAVMAAVGQVYPEVNRLELELRPESSAVEIKLTSRDRESYLEVTFPHEIFGPLEPRPAAFTRALEDGRGAHATSASPASPRLAQIARAVPAAIERMLGFEVTRAADVGTGKASGGR